MYQKLDEELIEVTCQCSYENLFRNLTNKHNRFIDEQLYEIIRWSVYHWFWKTGFGSSVVT